MASWCLEYFRCPSPSGHLKDPAQAVRSRDLSLYCYTGVSRIKHTVAIAVIRRSISTTSAGLGRNITPPFGKSLPLDLSTSRCRRLGRRIRLLRLPNA